MKTERNDVGRKVAIEDERDDGFLGESSNFYNGIGHHASSHHTYTNIIVPLPDLT